MKRLSIILSLVSLLIGSVVTPAHSFADKCLTTKKFKEVDERTFLTMSKSLNKYTNQALVLRAYIEDFSSETTFFGHWFGKGPESWSFAQKRTEATGWDTSKKKNRFSKLVAGDEIRAKVIIFSGGTNYLPVFIVCSATVIESID